MFLKVDQTQNYYDPEIYEEYLIHDTVPDMTYNVFGGTLNIAQLNSYMIHPSSCHIMYSHVQSADYTIAINTTLKGKNFCIYCEHCESKI